MTTTAATFAMILLHSRRKDPSALAAAMPGTPYAQAADVTFARAMPARSWLQASNPSERWKWDFMYQDLPPVKGHNVQMESALPQGAVPLTPVGNKP